MCCCCFCCIWFKFISNIIFITFRSLTVLLQVNYKWLFIDTRIVIQIFIYISSRFSYGFGIFVVVVVVPVSRICFLNLFKFE